MHTKGRLASGGVQACLEGVSGRASDRERAEQQLQHGYPLAGRLGAQLSDRVTNFRGNDCAREVREPTKSMLGVKQKWPSL